MRDLRVVEVAGGVAGAYCSRLFAVMGADVVLVEPSGGAPSRRQGPHFTAADGTTRSAMHEHLDAGKRSVTIDLDGPDGDAALGWADVVVATFDGVPDAAFALRERLRGLNRRASLVAVSGFGLTGPYAGWRTSDLVDWAAGGYLFLTGEPGRPPLQGGGPWASVVVGATAAVGGAVAVLDATLTDEGQLVDVGGMEATAAGHQWALTQYTHTGVLKRRVGLGFEHFHPLGPHRCQDGWIVIAAPSAEQWNQTCITCAAWDLMLDETLIAPAARADRAAEIDAALDPWLSTHTCAEAVAALQANRVPAGKVNDLHEVLASEHLAVRHAWTARPDLGPRAKAASVPLRLEPGPHCRAAEPAALAVGADTATFLTEVRAGPPARREVPPVDLRDVRVAEFSIAWAGPLTGRCMADLGAEVIKVEHPGSRGVGHEGRTGLIGGPPGWRFGDPVDPQIRAEVFPNADPGEHFWNRSGVWNVMNRGKRSLAMEAKTPEGKQILEEVLAGVDVVVHNYSPRGASSLGIDGPAVAKLNAEAITVAMTGYGETGPMALFFSFGPLLEAYCGLNSVTGYAGEEPLRLGKAFPDVVGGLHGTFTTLCALWERAATGAAVHADLSQLETLASVVGDLLLWTSVTGELPERRGNRALDHAPQGVYRCRGDDAWLAVSVTDDEGWRAVADLLGADGGLTLDERFARHDELDTAIERWCSGRDALDAATRLQAAGVPACPAFSNGDLVESEHLAARDFMVTWDQPDAGPLRFPGFPIHFERRRYEPVAAPALGADNAAILRRLGYPADRIDELAAGGVIADRPPW